ncbi:MAG TPA: VCBS repeat-containing protein, partial [Acidobacteriota bacterium]
DNTYILPGNGNGTFGTPVVYPTAKGPRSGVTADVNHDGKLDLIFGNANANNVSVLLNLCNATAPCSFEDLFDDGVIDPSKWSVVKTDFTEANNFLIGTPSKKKAVIVATGFPGCSSNCTIDTYMETAGGTQNKVWLLGWYIDKRNTIEVMMKEENDKWIVRQKVGGVTVAKTKALAAIDPNVSYHVVLSYDGSRITLNVNGSDIATLNPSVNPTGTAGYEVKNTTARFDSICVR